MLPIGMELLIYWILLCLCLCKKRDFELLGNKMITPGTNDDMFKMTICDLQHILKDDMTANKV